MPIEMLVQLLYFPGCPHVEATRNALHEVLAELTEHPDEVLEVDVTARETPVHLQGWGSPTILIDGVDIEGVSPSGASCRIYRSSDGGGAPSRALIRAALIRASSPLGAGRP
jgi:hypothetical protein